MKRIFILCLIVLIPLSCTTTQKSTKKDDRVISSNEGSGGDSGGTAIQKTTKDSVAAELPDANKEKEVKVSEFILGVGDELEVTVYRHDDLNRKIRVPPDGIATFPLIGEIQTKGISIHQFREKIKEALSVYVESPQISIEITAYKSQKIFILGEVRMPGVYPIDTPTTVLEAVSKAGGFTLDGKDNNVLLIRGGLEKPELKTLDLKKTLNKGDLAQNAYLQTGDIVYVPRTFISNVDRFFEHVERIIRPIVIAEQGIILGPRARDVFEKGGTTEQTSLPIAITIQK